MVSAVLVEPVFFMNVFSGILFIEIFPGITMQQYALFNFIFPQSQKLLLLLFRQEPLYSNNHKTGALSI